MEQFELTISDIYMTKQYQQLKIFIRSFAHPLSVVKLIAMMKEPKHVSFGTDVASVNQSSPHPLSAVALIAIVTKFKMCHLERLLHP